MLTGGSMFSGIGLLDYGLHLAGIRHLWLCEREADRRAVLEQRWPDALVLDDVRRVGADTVPRVDLLAGGFPCKGASSAGKQEGFGHPETVLWHEMARAIGELRPRYVVVENVANILALHDGAVWGTVLGDLAALGYDTVWDCLPAAAIGAPHLRDRVFAVATDADGAHEQRHASLQRVENGRADARGGGQAAADDPRDAEGRTGTPAGTDRERARAGDHAASDADRGRLSEQPECDRERRRREYGSQRDDAQRRGVRVEWGDYEPAIRRWEAVHGPAPEPLVRGVDDRSAARLERSALSALGDGVQVQVGQLVGAYIVGLEQQRQEGRLAA